MIEIIYNADGTVTMIDGDRVKTVPNDENLDAALAAFSPAPVPTSVTPLQMRKALRHLGLKATVDAYVATLDEEAAEEWEYALAIEWTNPQIDKAVTAMGWTTEQKADLFCLAASM